MAFTEFREKSDLEEYLHDLDQGSQYDRYAERLWKENVRDLQSAEQTVQVWLGTAASRLSRAPTRLSDLLGQLRGAIETEVGVVAARMEQAVAEILAAARVHAEIADSPYLPGSARYLVTAKKGEERYKVVNLVLAGGGMLGIAQVGFLYILEKCNFRFHTLGGASAGAITALLLAAIRKNPLDEASTAILKLLALNPFKSFKDRADSQNQKYADAFVDDIVKRLEPGGDQGAKASAGFPKRSSVEQNDPPTSGLQKLFKPFRKLKEASHDAAATLGALSSWAGFAWTHKWMIKDTFEHGGVYEGDAFEAWLKDILDNYGVSDNSSLETKMSWKDVDLVCTERWIKAFYGEEFMDKLAQLNDTAAPPMLILEHLVLVASDVSARKIAIFPQESYDYWPKGAHPATYARASMSIPGFFVPKVATGPNAVEGPDPRTLLDGGTLSNFPYDLVKGEQHLIPTLGLQLGLKKPMERETTNNLPQCMYAMFNNSRHYHDSAIEGESYFESVDHLINVIGRVDVKQSSWLNFDMKLEEQLRLFTAGAQAACDLLERFDGSTYTWASLGKVDPCKLISAISKTFPPAVKR